MSERASERSLGEAGQVVRHFDKRFLGAFNRGDWATVRQIIEDTVLGICRDGLTVPEYQDLDRALSLGRNEIVGRLFRAYQGGLGVTCSLMRPNRMSIAAKHCLGEARKILTEFRRT
jgi:hypothetical protein